VERRRIEGRDEQDAYTRWRPRLFWQAGELARVKRRTHKRERREGRQETAWQAANDTAPGELFNPDCVHGCNGDCRQGGPSSCTFTCHDEIADYIRARLADDPEFAAYYRAAR
jgi:hypothetical protein